MVAVAAERKKREAVEERELLVVGLESRPPIVFFLLVCVGCGVLLVEALLVFCRCLFSLASVVCECKCV